MPERESIFESGPGGEELTDIPQSVERQADQKGPFFSQLEDAPSFLPTEVLGKIGRSGFTPRGIILEVMKELGLISEPGDDQSDKTRNEHIYEKLNSAVECYNELYLTNIGGKRAKNIDAMMELYDDTDGLELMGSPLPVEVGKLHERFKENEDMFDAEMIVRILALDHASAQGNGDEDLHQIA